jgi:replicative DNA helicase
VTSTAQRDDTAVGLPSRVPPNSLETETTVLGSILLDNDAYHQLEGRVKSGMFYKEANRKIFSAMEDLIGCGSPVDTVTLVEALRRRDQLDMVGGAAYIVGLADNVPTSVYARWYGDIVREKALLRGIIQAAANVMQLAYDQQDAPEALASRGSELFAEIGDDGNALETLDSDRAVDQVLETIRAVRAGERAPALRTGFDDLDALIVGLKAGSLNVVGARPSMGKTGWAINVAEYVAACVGPVAFFSLEMPGEQITMRRLAAEARVDMARLEAGNLNERDLEKIGLAAERLRQRRFLLQDPAELTVSELRARATRLHREHTLALIVVDYLQFMAVDAGRPNRGEDNENRDLTRISRGLKALARSTGVPVLALSQLSRQVEQRPNKRPTLADLRGSGSIEQDADLIAFLYRDEYYLGEKSEKHGIAEVLVRKNRNGRVGSVELQFHQNHVRFNNLQRR